jgi:hypothetical protein
MSFCSRCGGAVDFRYVNGRCIPLHRSGRCEETGGTATTYSGYSVSHDSTCFSTSCPKCSGDVFFIRHNGGSVWIDPPLGPPWTKHGCFESPTEGNAKNSLASDYAIKTTYLNASGAPIGVVKSSEVDDEGRSTILEFHTGRAGHQRIKTKFNAGFLLGKLCMYSLTEKQIWALEEPQYRFAITSIKNNEMSKCSVCNVEVTDKNLKRHMRKKHGVEESS